MIIFDELEFAEQMSKKGFIKKYSLYELSIYAKWIKYSIDNGDISTEDTYAEIETRLKEFCNKYTKNFNYDVDYKKIDSAIKSTEEYRLRLPMSINITEKEKKSILNLNNENYRRVVFVMLVVSKFYKLNNTKIVKDDVKSDNSDIKPEETKVAYYCNLTDSEIFKIANLKMPTIERNVMWSYLYKNNIIGITNGRNTTRVVKIVDDDINSSIAFSINDYSHIMLYYEKLNGVTIDDCQYENCKKVFKQNSKGTRKFCDTHRKYQKTELKLIKCKDCGKEILVNGIVKNKRRCDECQEIYNRKNKTIKQRKYREK